MTTEKYTEDMNEIVRQADFLIGIVEESAKNARSELVQRNLADRKNVLSANMQKDLDKLDKKYNEYNELKE